MRISILILIPGIFILMSIPCFPAKVIKHRFSVSYISGSPDGVYTERILGINGHFPGSTIHADIGDTLEIDLVNNIQHGNQNASIHWHGLHQKNGAIFQDGTNQITQCPLKNGQEQRYTIPLHQPGTFWYHSHVMSQYTEGLWGVLIVHPNEEVYHYDDELIITLGDWYHFNAQQNEEWLLSSAAFGGQPMPHSGLINGVGRYHCDFALRDKRFCDPALQMRPVFHVQKNKTYRVRVINTSAYASFNFTIDGHSLETIEVDSTMVVNPVVADIVSMSSGQRYSFLVRTNKTDRFFLPDHEPLLWTLLEGRLIPETVYPVEIEYMNVIQVVINNLSPTTPHPLHLHGHDFWVLGAGKIMDGQYDPERHNLTLTGARRDTVFLQAGSWIVIRFVADNPGVWTFHCHIDWHMLSGMSMVFIEARERALQEIKITDEAKRVCDMWK